MYLEQTNRTVRKEVYDLMMYRQLQDVRNAHEILDKLIDIRIKQSKNV